MTSHGNDFFIWVLQLFILYLVFAIREGGRTVGAGVVTKVLD